MISNDNYKLKIEDRVVDKKAAQDYKCCICLNLVQNPCYCPEEHLFCYECIVDRFKKLYRCVNDTCRLSIDNIPRSIQLEDKVDNLEVYCKYSYKIPKPSKSPLSFGSSPQPTNSSSRLIGGANTGSLFGSSSQTTTSPSGLFGSANPYESSNSCQPTTSTNGLFGATNTGSPFGTSSQPTTSTAGLFGSSNSCQPTNSSSLFGPCFPTHCGGIQDNLFAPKDYVYDPEGCREKIKNSECKQHESQCQFGWTLCKYNYGCEPVRRKDLDKHHSVCQHRPMTCDSCNKSIDKQSINRCNECIQNNQVEIEHLKQQIGDLKFILHKVNQLGGLRTFMWEINGFNKSKQDYTSQLFIREGVEMTAMLMKESLGYYSIEFLKFNGEKCLDEFDITVHFNNEERYTSKGMKTTLSVGFILYDSQDEYINTSDSNRVTICIVYKEVV